MLWQAALGLGALYFFSRGKKPAGSRAGGPAGATLKDTEDVWDVRNAGNDGASVFFDVYAPAGSFGPHAELYLMRIKRTGDGPPVFVSADPTNAETVPNVLAAAVRDLGVENANV